MAAYTRKIAAWSRPGGVRVHPEDDDLSIAIVLTTVASESDATTIARALVDERLAACVHVYPEMQSVYQWKGEVSVDTERQLVIKTTGPRLAALELRLAALHPYELPEFVVVRGAASVAYSRWVGASVD